jgi:dTDP-glucose 4,6-dehydratase
MKSILITGGAGFIGSNFINYLLNKINAYQIINLDKLTYAGNIQNLSGIADYPNYIFIKGDIVNEELVRNIFERYEINYVINFAAESHVDRSILSSEIFYRTNVIGTNVLLESTKKYGVEKFIQISTDEVYGSLGHEGKFSETNQLRPNSPYAASKAAADLMVLAYHHTFKVPVIITRCSNNYGPYQFPEKLIPLMIINSINNKKLPVYGDGLNVRDWVYVLDHCKAIELVLENGNIGEIYNIGANCEKKNIDIVKLILKELDKPEELIEFVKDRPGHDRRYAINSAKIKMDLGWEPHYSFEEAIYDTVKWYINNEKWWSEIISGEYQNYYEMQYSK